jgi:hypothetical protein
MNTAHLDTAWMEWIQANIASADQQKAAQGVSEALGRGGNTEEAISAAFAALATDSDREAWRAWVARELPGTPDEMWFRTNVALEMGLRGYDSEQAADATRAYASKASTYEQPVEETTEPADQIGGGPIPPGQPEIVQQDRQDSGPLKKSTIMCLSFIAASVLLLAFCRPIGHTNTPQIPKVLHVQPTGGGSKH